MYNTYTIKVITPLFKARSYRLVLNQVGRDIAISKVIYGHRAHHKPTFQAIKDGTLHVGSTIEGELIIVDYKFNLKPIE